MSVEQNPSRHEVIGIFHTSTDLQAAIDELLSAGFDRAELSFLASADSIEEKLGHAYQEASDIADNPEIPRASHVSTEEIGDAQGGLIGGLVYVGALVAAGAVVVSDGSLAAAFAAAAVSGGVGGYIGSLLGRVLGDHHAKHLQDQIDKGGLLLWVHARDADHEARSLAILRTYCGDNVHVRDKAIAA